MANWTVSDFAAWWGAVVASLALFWNIVLALRAGSKIVVSVNPDMTLVPSQPGNMTYISVIAVNRGDASTTITHCCGYCKTARWRFGRRKKQHFFVTCGASLGNTVPHVFSPGEEWHNLADRAELQSRYPDGHVYLGVIHNQRRRPIYKRVLFKK